MLYLDFSLKDTRQLGYFLGIEVHHSLNGSLHSSQIHQGSAKENMINSKGVTSPIVFSTKFSTKLSKYGPNHVVDTSNGVFK